ncbi:Lsr2 family protein [Cellulomonas sp. DKR-3]|uniref:Lsr2 family protein n=1 Tax=Cellulomonas fulva TaxID=2835530 RepID=A0ABS5U282_9CELL|nr:Lsr2 family protein [Cellulomonas fulva]MBT0995481.1 Lsr2 family protein [Cellulomonas fulva]
MAQKILVTLTSDISGEPADETVTFALDGVAYEADLTTAEAVELRATLATWIGHGRKVAGGRPATRRRSRSTGAGSPADIRAWAVANGHSVPARGRIPQTIQDAYRAAH